LLQAVKPEAREITKEGYDKWCYNYPKVEVERTKAARDEYRAKKNNKKELLALFIWNL